MKPPRAANDVVTWSQPNDPRSFDLAGTGSITEAELNEVLRVLHHFGRLFIKRICMEMVTDRLGEGWAK